MNTGRGPTKRAAVWGWGSHAKKHVIPAFLASETFDLVAIASRHFQEPEERLIDGKPVMFCQEAEVLAHTGIDTVYITTPNGLHYRHCLQALNAGKHVLCEKSLTTSLSESLELINLARRRRLFLAETFMYVFHPQYLELKRLLSRGELGTISTITCEFGVPLRDNPGFRRTAALGGGAFWDVACYNISILVQLFDQTPDVVTAFVETPKGRNETDEGGWAVARLQPNICAFLAWGYSRSYRNHLMLWGDRGSASLHRIFSKPEDYESSIDAYDEVGARHRILTGQADSFVNMLNDLGKRMDLDDCREYFFTMAERQAYSMHRLSLAAGTLLGGQ